MRRRVAHTVKGGREQGRGGAGARGGDGGGGEGRRTIVVGGDVLRRSGHRHRHGRAAAARSLSFRAATAVGHLHLSLSHVDARCTGEGTREKSERKGDVKMRKEREFRRTKLVGMNFVPRVDFFPFPPPSSILSMGLLAFLSRWLKPTSSSSSAAPPPKRPQALALVIPHDEKEHTSSSSLDASPLQAGLARFSPSRRNVAAADDETVGTASPSPRGAQQQQQQLLPSVRSPAPTATAASPSPSPQKQQLEGRKPFAELSPNKVKEEKMKNQCLCRERPKSSPPPTSLSQNQKNSPLPRGPSRSSQRQRRRQ